MVAVSTEFCKNKTIAHGKYWMCPGSLNCCTLHHQPEHARSDDIAQPIAFYYTPEVFDIISDRVRKNVS